MKGRTEGASIDHYILPNKFLCRIAGIWPIEEDSTWIERGFAYFRLIFALTAVSSVFVPEIMAIVANWGDLKVLTGVGCVAMTVGQLLFKMIYLLVRRERMVELYKEVRKFWNSSDRPKERISFERLARWARIFTIAFYLSCMCNVITFTIAAAVDYVKLYYNVSYNANRMRHLPFEVWYGTGITQSPSFEIAFVCQFLASLICAAGISGLDASFMTLILHVCGQFRLISTWINDIGKKISPKYARHEISHNFKIEIDRCIQHHQYMINIVKETNNLLCPIIFVQLLTSGLEICLSGFAIIADATGTDLLKFISYLSSMLVQLIIWSWPAEILIEESQQIGNVVYFDVPWYYLPPSYRRQLCLIIVRTQKYCHITALTFKTMSISTLTDVFNTAGSYFALLRQMQQS